MRSELLGRDCEQTKADHDNRPADTCGNFTLFIPYHEVTP